MVWSTVQFSIVVLAADNNPTILNPDFLKTHQIVPADWELSGPPLTTPPFATVQYKNGIRIVVEPQKIEFVHVKPDSPSKSSVPNIVKNYIHTVPLVRYQAVGINFVVSMDVDSPVSVMQSSFLKGAPIADERLSLLDMGIKFGYSLNQAKFTVGYDIARKVLGKKKVVVSGILANANFHEEVNFNHLQDSVNSIINKTEDYWNLFKKTISEQIHFES